MSKFSVFENLKNEKGLYVDHFGNEFKTITGICKYHGISSTALKNRLEDGEALSSALTKRSRGRKAKVHVEFIKYSGGYYFDHLKNKFISKDAMYRHWNIRYQTAERRLSMGWSLERTLTTPIDETKSWDRKTSISCYDHEGNHFVSKKSMCDYWNIDDRTYHARICRGYSVEAALTEK